MYLNILLWLPIVVFRLWWRWVVGPSRLWTAMLLQPRVASAVNPLSRRIGTIRTVVVAVGAAAAELQWRWGTDEFGSSLWDWVEGFFTGPIALGASVVVFAVVFPLSARAGERRVMLRRVAVPVLVVLASGVLLAVLPAVAAGWTWVGGARGGAMSWASDGLYGTVLVLAGAVFFAVILYFPPMLVLGAWMSARGCFRAGDAHPLMPAAATILAGLLLVVGPTLDAINGSRVDPDLPVWAAIGFSLVVPFITIALSVIELVRLIAVGGWRWRSSYLPVSAG